MEFEFKGYKVDQGIIKKCKPCSKKQACIYVMNMFSTGSKSSRREVAKK
jgi:hypothetical protein